MLRAVDINSCYRRAACIAPRCSTVAGGAQVPVVCFLVCSCDCVTVVMYVVDCCVVCWFVAYCWLVLLFVVIALFVFVGGGAHVPVVLGRGVQEHGP